MRLFNDAYLKNIGILFSGNILAQLIPFILAPIITRIFSPEELGIHGNFVALVTLISIIANGRLELAIVLPKADTKAVQLLKLGLKISIGISLICFSLLLIKAPLEQFYQTKLLSQFLPLVAITVFIISTHNLLIQWLVRIKLFYSISMIKILLSIYTNSLFILLGWLQFGVSGLIFSYIIGFGLTTFVLFLMTKKNIPWNSPSLIKDKKLLLEYKEFPLINSLHAFSDILFQDFIILAIITSQFGLVTAGLFVVMMKYLKAPVRFIGSAIGQVFYPEGNQNRIEGKSNKLLLGKSIKISILVAIPIILIVAAAGPKLFGWYLGEQWIESGFFARIMILPIALGLITSPISSIPLIYNKQKTSFLINIVGMSIGALTFYFISLETNSIKQSLIGLAIVQSLLYLTLMKWYYQLSKR